ncbi:hypothetical protein LCGC14_2149960 [marine sediment metagenome]|uniref:Terminase large subunit GpA endonuclease domain-containing protein n=1 Tax=marine sediment metagenome TaxID=412755 RepID=A0A0F9G8T2_9ZZZZ
MIFCLLTGLVRFPLIAAATGPDAQRILDHLKGHLERNELLAADFPEVCYPIRALEGAPQRAGSQTVGGKRTYLKWAQDYIILPTVKGSKASGSAIMTRGLDAAIRGIRVGALRPDLVIIDDPETRESVRSEQQTATRELTIEEDLAGLGGGDKKLARVMLTTLMRRVSLSATYTDRQEKPSWKGRRFKLLDKFPHRTDLWEEYQALRAENFVSGDEHARGAHAFYLANRKAMDAGAVIVNVGRFNGSLLEDGTQAEASALQRCYNIIADRGLEHFLTEYQNDPPEESGPIDSGITAGRIQRQVSGYPHRVIPPGCTVLTMAIDVGKYALHWVVKAWRPDCTGFVIDYAVQDVHGTTRGTDDENTRATDRAIIKALYTLREQMLANPYRAVDDKVTPIDKTLVDAGYRTQAVYHFCREAGIAFQPAKGMGKSSGCVEPYFRAPVRITTDKRPGDGWFLSRQPSRVWMVGMDTDRWKGWEHDRWLTPPTDPGSCLLFGERGLGDRLSQDQKDHFVFAKHLTAEVEREENVPKKGMVRSWHVKPGRNANHYFDASYMADVAANMCGISLMRKSKLNGKRKSAQELADLARAAK